MLEKIAWLKSIKFEEENYRMRDIDWNYFLENIDSDLEQLAVLVNDPRVEKMIFLDLRSERVINDGRNLIIQHINSAVYFLYPSPRSMDRKTFLARIESAEMHIKQALEILPAQIRNTSDKVNSDN